MAVITASVMVASAVPPRPSATAYGTLTSSGEPSGLPVSAGCRRRPADVVDGHRAGAGLADPGDEQPVAVGVGVVAEHVEHERRRAGDDLGPVVERLGLAVLAAQRHHADEDLADAGLAALVDDDVGQAVGPG